MKKTAKKGLFTVIALITVLAVSVSAFAAGFTRQDAQKLALKDAGLRSTAENMRSRSMQQTAKC